MASPLTSNEKASQEQRSPCDRSPAYDRGCLPRRERRLSPNLAKTTSEVGTTNIADEGEMPPEDIDQAPDQALDQALESAILRLLADRGAGKTICPSEAARMVDPARWEELMENARAAAYRLVAQGAIVITQKGTVVDPSQIKGAIRLRLR